MHPQYRFEVRNAAGTLTYSRDWTTGRSTWWTPAAAGTYTCKVLLRDGAAGTPVEASASYVVKAKLSLVYFTSTGVRFRVGQPCTVSATAVGRTHSRLSRPLHGLIEPRHSFRNVSSLDGSYGRFRSAWWLNRADGFVGP